MIREVTEDDAKKIADIYNHYVQNTTATFEEHPVSAQEMEQRIEKVQQSGLPWLVFELGDSILGYAYASVWNQRTAYRYTVETSVYLTSEAAGQGFGAELYQQLLDKLRDLSIRNVLSVITQPNPNSVALHESLGFKKAGEFSNVGYKFDKWLSVGYWQLQMFN
ncbi:N-acetyltransferase family protein [Vibrio sp. JC009]|uniref:GNAT family N-acetyltransferase n=1 Tax=Vibrio sp. JC009 TaxID=2912314 RepID=UPI0023AF57B1|nr:GNAT family N-acetyltransferase [Vibrio sp. JC009]WED23562.1 N-acetyltransferase family protein [Vibrio sp. JC009]